MLPRQVTVRPHMDVFSRTFLPAAAEAGVTIPTVSRHMPILRRCVEPDEATVLVTRCVSPDRPLSGEFLLLLTYRRMVVTQETRVLHRLRLHLNANLRHLSDVTWAPDLRASVVDLAATAVDGVRERFRMRLAEPDQVWHVDALLKHVFRERHPPAAPPAPALPRPPRSAVPPNTLQAAA
jgi:hypothetical protein